MTQENNVSSLQEHLVNNDISVWETGSIIVILLTKDEDSLYVESSEAFTKILLEGEYDFNIGFDHSGGMEAVERMLRCGCEEVIV